MCLTDSQLKLRSRQKDLSGLSEYQQIWTRYRIDYPNRIMRRSERSYAKIVCLLLRSQHRQGASVPHILRHRITNCHFRREMKSLGLLTTANRKITFVRAMKSNRSSNYIEGKPRSANRTKRSLESRTRKKITKFIYHRWLNDPTRNNSSRGKNNGKRWDKLS